MEIRPAKRAQGAEPPVGVIEQPRIGLPVDKGIFVVVPVERLGHLGGLGKALAQRTRPIDPIGAGRGTGKGGRRCGGVFRDEIARPAARREVVIGDQLGIGQRHGDPADPKVLGQLAGRGQLFAVSDPARQDALGDHLLDAHLKRALGMRIEKEGFDWDGHVPG